MSYLPIKKTYSDLSSPNSVLPLPSKGNLASIWLLVEIFISIFFRESKKMHQMPDPRVSTELLRNKPVGETNPKKGITENNPNPTDSKFFFAIL